MKKICILSAVNIRHMTLISLYTDILDRSGIDYDIVYMDKYGEEEVFSAKRKFIYKNKIKQKWPRWFKALKYLLFIPYAKKILKKNKYDFIIVWNDVAILMFANYLAKKWKGKYCLNIRDYCYQNESKFIYKRFDRAIKSSAFTTISSDGYKEFLPEYNYVQIHSLNKSILQQLIPRVSFQENTKPIRITFVGYVRYYDVNKKLMEIFKNDSRFELCFFGTNASILENYAKENSIDNVKFHGTFPVKDTAEYIKNTDLINNIYGNNRIGLRQALSIKLYHGVYYRVPILVNKDTWGEKLIKQYNIGFVIEDIDETMKENLYQWYTNLSFEEFNKGCFSFLDNIEKENNNFNVFVTNALK